MNEVKCYFACAYLRISQSDGEQGTSNESNSIVNQRALLNEFLKKHDEIVLCNEKVDDGYSGVNFDRPAFQEMIKEIEKGKINCVIVKDLSRFGRNYIEAGYYQKQLFNRYGVRFIAINDSIDTITEQSRNDNIIMPIRNIINDAYSGDISIKVRSQFEIMRKKGEFISAFAVYGYKKDPKNNNHLIIDQYAAVTIKDIFKWRLNGLSHKSIADNLNLMGVLAPSDYKISNDENYKTNLKQFDKSLWTVDSICKILSNEIYIGNMVQGKRTTINLKIKKVVKLHPEQWIRVEDTHEPIIKKEEFQLVQKLENMDTRTSPNDNIIYTLSGFLYCADCKQPMVRKTVTRNGIKYIYYICSSYKNKGSGICTSHIINSVNLEKVIFELLNKHINAEVDLANIVQQEINNPDIEISKREDYISKKIQRKSEVQRFKSALYEDYLEELITKNEYLELKEFYTKQIDILSESIELLNISNGVDNYDKRKKLSEFISGNNICKLTRGCVLRTIDRIYVHNKNSINISYRFGSAAQNN